MTTIDNDIDTAEFGGGWDKVARDGHGRWTSGGGVSSAATGVKAERRSINDRLKGTANGSDERAAILTAMDADGTFERASTASQHKLANGRYSAERQAQQEALIDAYIAEKTAGVPKDGQAIILGGLPGSGKGSALDNPVVSSQVDASKYAHVDPDEVKALMLRRNMVDRVPGLTDGEHAALLHEESGDLTDAIVARIQSDRTNIVLDKTMASSQAKKIQQLRDGGYTDVKGVYVFIPVDESADSAMLRWKEGGRFIPPSVIESSRRPDGRVKNLEIFQDDVALFDSHIAVDNTGISKKDPVTGRRMPRGTVMMQSDNWADGGGAQLAVWLADDTGVHTIELGMLDADVAAELLAEFAAETDVIPGGDWDRVAALKARLVEFGLTDDAVVGVFDDQATFTVLGADDDWFALRTETFGVEHVPRDYHGRWKAINDTDASSPAETAQLAARVKAGERVEVAPRDLPALLTEMASDTGAVDLTLVTTKGHSNLFAEASRNRMDRASMPQIGSEHLEGFRQELNARGISTRIAEVDPADLKATQNDLNAVKVGGMINAMRAGTFTAGEKPIWVSSDGRILDGHHRWAAEAALSVSGEPRTMKVVVVDAPMSVLLPMAAEYAARHNIASKTITMTADTVNLSLGD